MLPDPAPIVLTIAGSDPSGGAGLQSDLRTFATAGLYGLAVPTAITVQTAGGGVTRSDVLAADLVAAQLRAALSEGPLAAAKTGMLGSAANVEAVAEAWAQREVPLVVDPVIRSSSGADLLGPGGVAAVRTRLLPCAALVTPNLAEAAWLVGSSRWESPEDLARAVVDLGAAAALVTGGHGGGATVRDVLWFKGALTVFEAPRIGGGESVHGTGCLLSASVVVELARGRELVSAVEAVIEAVRERLSGRPPGTRRGAVGG
jgi:hydroxymethylpyrimidine/phosphomethylpyrimidine kinase